MTGQEQDRNRTGQDKTGQNRNRAGTGQDSAGNARIDRTAHEQTET